MATPFHLAEEDLPEAAAADETELDMMSDKIPILKRRAVAAAAGTTTTTDANGGRGNNDPICVIVVGMAGSGKTTLMAQLQRSLNMKARDGEGGGDDGGDDAAVAVGDNKEKIDENDKKKAASLSSSEVGKDVKKDVKTTSSPSRAGYAINLDPAAKYIPFSSSIDIRDTVDYLEVMRQHKLGPNGAILTCLNLFATKFDQVMDILERRAFGWSSLSSGAENDNGGEGTKHAESEEKAAQPTTETITADLEKSSLSSSPSPLDYILIDTPGQIEAFTWSASGTIVTSAMATTFPTVLAFVIDTPRCAASVHTFMSNMLYACSMLYRAKLPMVVVLNKTDVVGCEFIKEWMDDYESFQEALDDASQPGNGYSDEMAGGGGGYYSSLTRSLSLVLDEFYNHLHKVGVSAATGDGVDEFWEVVQKAAVDYEEGYLVDLRLRIDEQRAKEMAMKRVGARRLVRDLEEDEMQKQKGGN